MTETHLIDETGRTVFRGTQSPGGGSMPVVKVTLTAAEISAAWDVGSGTAWVVTTCMPDGVLLGMVVGALPDSLPANMAASAFAASDPGFTAPLSTQVNINATDIGYQAFGGMLVPGFSNASSQWISATSAAICDGSEAVAFLVRGDGPPESGSADIYLIVWPRA